MMNMNSLSIDKVNKIIELAKLIYGAKTLQSVSDMKLTDSNTQAKELIEFLIECQTLNTPINNGKFRNPFFCDTAPNPQNYKNYCRDYLKVFMIL